MWQELRAVNHYYRYDYKLYFWRTAAGLEVDLVLYGPKGVIAIEVKRSARVTNEMFHGLMGFLKEYPAARAYLLSGAVRDGWEGNIRVMPVEKFLKEIHVHLNPPAS